MNEMTGRDIIVKRTRRSNTREEKLIERRQSLLDATLRVVARKGLIGVTMSDIATEAGCAYGVVAFHFKSKEGITLAALDYMVEEYDRTLQWSKYDAPEARLKAMINLDFNTRASDPGHVAVFTAFWAEAARTPEYAKRCADMKSRYDAVVKADIATLAERYKVKLDPALVARSLNALIDGMWISGQVFGNIETAGHKQGKKACMFYLHSIFPDCF
jgi:AcrR family transcriptional regulator